MTPSIEVVDLEKRFGSVVAASGITLSIPEGQVVGIIGANGAGKTTFVNMVTGYLTPSSGSIKFDGRDITGMTSREITKIGICRSFQMAQIFPTQSAADNLLMAQGIADLNAGNVKALSFLSNKDRNERVARTLEEYGIAEYADMQASALPQGVRKLLDIAMAVAASPKVMLLDEPTSGVSASAKFDVMDAVIPALKQNGITILFVEHDMEIVERYSDRVLAFVDGTVIADGPPSEVLANARVREMIIGEHLDEQKEGGHASH